MTSLVKEGWYEDPARRHEYRWFSKGEPTNLVKDGGTTSQDSIAIKDGASYESVDLAEPPDDGPLIYRASTSPRLLQILNAGRGPMSPVGAVARSLLPGVWSSPAGRVETVAVVLPIVAAFVLLLTGAPVWICAVLLVLSLLIGVSGAIRRRRQARKQYDRKRSGSRTS